MLHGLVKQDTRSPAVIVAFLADALDRHHLLILVRVEHDHALRRAASDTDALNAGPNELAAIGYQHDLVLVLDRERGHHAAGLAGDRHGDDAFAATAGGSIFVRRTALAKAALGERQHELLGLRHFYIALLAELDRAGCLLRIGSRLLGFGCDAAPHRACALEIGGTLLGAGVEMAQDRERDHPVAFGERDAAHAHRGAALEPAHA